VTEEIVLRMANYVYKETEMKNLCLAGGVALNCVANGRLLKEGPFDDIWIQPAAGDAGGAIGAALIIWHQYLENERIIPHSDKMNGAYLGPEYSEEEILDFFNSHKIPFTKLSTDELPKVVSELLANENVIGWFQGRMEFGPRALGNRSILGDARSPKMQETMNLKIKFRESFRPFAPSILAEKISDYFEFEKESPYMLLVANVKKERRKEMTEEQKRLFGIDKLNIPRSDIPAVTHIDYSARIQTVHQETNKLYYDLIAQFEKEQNCAVIVNTSFNVRGEPIVCSPSDAYKCFMRTNMDYLVLGNFLLDKKIQPPFKDDINWKKEFELD
jgi:carbamoyltransferase